VEASSGSFGPPTGSSSGTPSSPCRFATLLANALAHNPQLQQEIIGAAVAQFPVLGTQIEGSIRTIQGSGIGLVVGILGSLWGGLGITQSAQDAMNALWSIPHKHRPSYWWRLARGLGSLLLLAGGVILATALPQLGRIWAGPAGYLSFAGSLLLNLRLLAVVSRC